MYRYARALDGIGVGHGDLVALFAPNSPDALAVRYAAHLCGAATMYLPALPAPHLRTALVELVAPDLLVAFPETAHLLPTAAAVRVAVVGCDVPGAWLRLDWRARGASAAPMPCRARPGDLAVAISSGGSTGVPKGSLRSFADYTITVATGPDPARRQLAKGPLAHLTQLLVDTTLLGGGTVVLQDEVEPAATLAAIESAQITDLFLVEPQLFAVIDHPDVATRDLSSLRAVVHIGASAPATLRRRARARLGAVVAHTYGASETGIVSALPPAEHDRPERFACAGRPRPGVEVRFRRTDGTLAGPGEAGVAEVRSPQVASGNRNRPAEAAAAFVDGWYRTGDVALPRRRGLPARPGPRPRPGRRARPRRRHARHTDRGGGHAVPRPGHPVRGGGPRPGHRPVGRRRRHHRVGHRIGGLGGGGGRARAGGGRRAGRRARRRGPAHGAGQAGPHGDPQPRCPRRGVTRARRYRPAAARGRSAP